MVSYEIPVEIKGYPATIHISVHAKNINIYVEQNIMVADKILLPYIMTDGINKQSLIGTLVRTLFRVHWIKIISSYKAQYM